VTDAAAPTSNVVAAETNAADPVTNVVTAVPTVVTPLTDVVATIPELFASIPALVASSIDFIVAVQDLFTSVAAEVVPLAHLPYDLLSMLGVPSAQPVASGSAHAGALSLASAATVPVPPIPLMASQLLLPRPVAAAHGGGSVGNAALVTALSGRTTTQVGQDPLRSETPAAAAKKTNLNDARARIAHAFGKVLRSASLWEIAAVALPGLGGLLVFTATGVRVGHRQAKAGFALDTRGIARFARSGPIGVVRSGSLVAIRRAASAVPQCLLDEAA
jgi:hypothetical protein